MPHAIDHCYSLLDPAIDIEAMGEDVAAYARARDPALVRIVPGCHAVRFALRLIPASLYQSFVMAAPSEALRRRRAFQCSVTEVAHLRDAQGELHTAPLVPTHEARCASGPVVIWGEEETDLVPVAYVDEIGAVCEVRSFLPPGCEASFALPPTSQAAVVSRVSRLVAARLAAAAQSSDAPKAAPPPPPSPAGAEPTDATATG